MKTIFQYQPLNPERREIRLLYIDPGSYSEPHRVNSVKRAHYTVRHASLLDEPVVEYNAISYCWGQHQRQRSIKVDGLVLDIPESAEEALRRTYRTEADCQVPAWIDGVCINQADIKEKAQQVAMMGEVYRKASRVLVWLGEEDDQTTCSVSSIYEILDYCRELAKCVSQQKISSHLDSQDDSSASEMEMLPLPPPATWDAMYSFFEVPYFTRLWPVQEIVLAKDATIVRGGYSIPWSDIAQMADMILLSKLFLRTASRREVALGHYGFGNAGLISALKRSNSGSLSNLLYLTTNFTTSDTRDRVYAVLGMHQTFPATPGKSVLAGPDYAKPVKDVYINATVAAMEPPNSLLTLRIAQYCCPIDRSAKAARNCSEEVPSWVARYDLGEKQERGTPSYFDVAFPGATADLKANFVHHQTTPNVLHIQGIIVDNVTARSATKPWEPGPLHFGQFIRSLIMPSYIKRGATPEDNSTSINAGSYVASHFEKSVDSGREQIYEGSTDTPSYQNEKLPSARLLKRGFNRSLFVTSRGLTGMGPWSYEAGDSVVVIFGCVAPLILRREGDFWRLMGDSYVDCIMDGQYIEHLRSTGCLKAETQWFSIH